MKNRSLDFEQYAKANNTLMQLLHEDKEQQQEQQHLQQVQLLLDDEKKKNASLISNQADISRLVYEKSQELKKAEIIITQLQNDDENRATISKLEGDIESGRQLVKEMKITIEKKDNELSTLKTNLKQLTKEKNEKLENKTIELNNIKKKLEDVMGENYRVNAEKSKLECVLEKYRVTVKEVSSTLEEKEDELVKLKITLDKLTNEGLDELKNKTAETNNVQKMLTDAVEENVRLRTENVQLKNELKVVNNSHDNPTPKLSDSDYSKLSGTISELADALKVVQKRLDYHDSKSDIIKS